MVRQKEYRESKEKTFYVSILDVDFESGEVLFDLLVKCVATDIGDGYYNITTDDNFIMVVNSSDLFFTMEEATEDHNKKIRGSLKHIAKLNRLAKKLQKELC